MPILLVRVNVGSDCNMVSNRRRKPEHVESNFQTAISAINARR